MKETQQSLFGRRETTIYHKAPHIVDSNLSDSRNMFQDRILLPTDKIIIIGKVISPSFGQRKTEVSVLDKTYILSHSSNSSSEDLRACHNYIARNLDGYTRPYVDPPMTRKVQSSDGMSSMRLFIGSGPTMQKIPDPMVVIQQILRGIIDEKQFMVVSVFPNNF